MLLSLWVVVWCWGLLSRRPTLLRRQGMSKGRCCVLFSDLKVFLLRPPVPAPPPAIIPMNGQYTDSNGSGTGIDVAADNSNSAASAPPPEADGYAAPVPPTGEPHSAGTNEPKATEEWQHATGQTGPLDYGSSEEDCFKAKCEERFSLNSRTDSGVRTPQCRICFQGPEQVSGLTGSQ